MDKQYLKPEEEEALRIRDDRKRGGMLGGITWYVTTENGREVLRMYRGNEEVGL